MNSKAGSYRNLIFLLTRSCTLSCPECNIKPQLDDGASISPAFLERWISPSNRQRIRAGIIWSGGEPLLKLDSLVYGLHLARENGFRSEILTGGAWPLDADTILNSLAKFRSELNLRLSIDGPHFNQIGPTRIKELCTAILEGGFKLGFTYRQPDPFAPVGLQELKIELLEIFRRHAPEQLSAAHFIHHLPHMPDEDCRICPPGPPAPAGPPKCKLAEKDLVLAWDERRYACCGLFVSADNRALSLDTEPNQRIFALLRQQGPLALAERLKIALPVNLCADSASPCTLCRYLWKNHPQQLTGLAG